MLQYGLKLFNCFSKINYISILVFILLNPLLVPKKNKKEIEFIINALKKNEFYNENFGLIEKLYGLTIVLKDKSEISFKIIKSKDNIYPELLNKNNGEYYTIGTYKNNSISKILLD
mgnify:CR=1 FL=1